MSCKQRERRGKDEEKVIHNTVQVSIKGSSINIVNTKKNVINDDSVLYFNHIVVFKCHITEHSL